MTGFEIDMRRGQARWLRVALLLALISVPLVWTGLAHQILEERRALLLRNLEVEATKLNAGVASLVRNRATDLINDLSLATSVLHQTRSVESGQIGLLRAQMVALDRRNRSYVRLWYLRGDEVVIDVAGSRGDVEPDSIPVLDTSILTTVAHRARQNRGTAVRERASLGDHPKFEHLRLFAIAPPGDRDDVLMVLVSLDALFAALHTQVRLPGTDLWVVDSDGTVLVGLHGGDSRAQEVLALLSSSDAAGTRFVGPLPSLWPWSTAGRNSRLLSWRTNPLDTFVWTSGIAVHLSAATAELRELAALLVLVFVSIVVLVGAAGTLVWWLARRQAWLQERVEHLSRVTRLREQLIRAEKLSTFGQIAAGVAHEIGTPLGVISLRLDQMKEQASSPRDRERAEAMKDQIERISRIIRQLLDYGRPATAEKRSVLLGNAVRRVAALLDHRLRRSEVELSIDVPDDLRLWADLDQLHQVLLNLLVNAVDAAREGGKIELSARDDDADYARLVLRDDGPGIDSDDPMAIFEPFFTTKEPGKGTGLGLTIVKDIVEGHGGDIDVDSHPGDTRFTVRWPRADGSLGSKRTSGASS